MQARYCGHAIRTRAGSCRRFQKDGAELFESRHWRQLGFVTSMAAVELLNHSASLGRRGRLEAARTCICGLASAHTNCLPKACPACSRSRAAGTRGAGMRFVWSSVWPGSSFSGLYACQAVCTLPPAGNRRRIALQEWRGLLHGFLSLLIIGVDSGEK